MLVTAFILDVSDKIKGIFNIGGLCLSLTLSVMEKFVNIIINSTVEEAVTVVVQRHVCSLIRLEAYSCLHIHVLESLRPHNKIK